MRKHTISIKNALRGLIWAVRTQPNYKIHIPLSVLAVIGGFAYKISYYEFLTIFTLIFIGLAIETINTAFEETNDAIDLARRPDIGLAKDIAAGAMLVFSIGAFIIACIIFVPKIF
jgi:diacylglycerol kinase (ATP)